MKVLCKDMLQIFHDQENHSIYFRLNHKHLNEP